MGNSGVNDMRKEMLSYLEGRYTEIQNMIQKKTLSPKHIEGLIQIRAALRNLIDVIIENN